MEGWFWRLTHAPSGTVVVALASVNAGRWGMAALALHPGGAVAEVSGTEASGEPLRLPGVLEADERRLRVTIGDDRLDVGFGDRVGWPRRALGGSGLGHVVPGIGQHWHPHMLGARVEGEAVIGGRHVALDGATAYAEKNWGDGFPAGGWWWGQAQGFDREDVCVAFAGGDVALASSRLSAGALVVRLGGELIHVVRPPRRLTTDGWSLRARGVEIEAAPTSAPAVLPVPVPHERRVVHGPSKQHLAADLRLVVRRRGRTLFDGTTALAGLERGGPQDPRS